MLRKAKTSQILAVSAAFRGASPGRALLVAMALAAWGALAPAQTQFEELPRRGLPVFTDETKAVELGDVDDDEDFDLACGDNVGQNRLYSNLQNQLDAPLPFRVGQTYTLDVYMRYGPASTGNLALPAISLGPASIPVPPYGTLGLDPATLVPLPLYSQALLVPGPFQALLSNVLSEVLVP